VVTLVTMVLSILVAQAVQELFTFLCLQLTTQEQLLEAQQLQQLVAIPY